MEQTNGKKDVDFFAVGDVVIARKDWEQSFARVESILKKADICFFNCETPYGESGCPGMAPTGAPPHHPRGMPALAQAGFNVCTLANNHTLDWGIDPVAECRGRLQKLGIAVCGAGKNIDEAREPAIVERKGVKIAFLGYCSTGPNLYLAEENKPGCAMVRIHTLYEPYDFQPGTPFTKVLTWAYKLDLEAMVEDIRKAREKADLVVMTDHWGVHNVPVMIPDYGFEVGHAAIDAGADLVLGTHPHILKGIEVYKGKVIVHSLGNFCMERRAAEGEDDQRILTLKSFADMRNKIYGPLHPDQAKSLILKCHISDGRFTRISYVPVQLDMTMANPEPLEKADPRAQAIFAYMQEITKKAGLSTEYRWDGDEVVVEV
ncbi:MAG TPA: CapA family protein [Syntrophorhabdaceae bacterium]|nr:CapA family protein [Syntrophorhabdaceae bacterium]